MRHLLNERTILGGLLVIFAGVSPNLFPAAQTGLAKMSVLGMKVLLPSIVLLIAVIVIAAVRGRRELVHRALTGAAVGFVATLGLEAIRNVSFHLGGMPGDMPRLLGVLLTNRFMLGPSPWSDTLGYAYHFWNGVSFGLIFTVLVGRKPILWAIIYAQLIGLGFLLSPAVQALGIGFMGAKMPAMPLTVVLAHLAFGLILGSLSRKWLGPSSNSLWQTAN